MPHEQPPDEVLLRDLLCVACERAGFRRLYGDLKDYEYGVAVSGLTVIQCLKCGLVQLHPMPAPEVLQSFYPEKYCDHFSHRTGLLRRLYSLFFGTRVKYIGRFAGREARVLDVGCSAGYLMSLMRSRNPGWKLTGVEMREEAVRLGRERGLDIVHGTVEEANLPDSHFDLIVLNALIEHLFDPAAMLARLHALLKPGGRLFVSTFNTDCLDFRMFGKCWGGLHIPRHTYLFNADNLSALLRAKGFRVLDARFSASPIGWALSVQNYLSGRFTLVRTNGRAAVYYPLLLAFLPVTFIQKLAARTAIMVMMAQREPASGGES